ncbi:MAG: leucine-rich repeat domain-containing protein [Treponema sp.]|nr:leucine-rich repeat domain-containing protein [Candidatus Treponema equifaecale]
MKKSISLILASVLVLGSFAGCANETEEKEINHYFCPECTEEFTTKEAALSHCADQKSFQTSILALGAVVEQLKASETAYSVKITDDSVSKSKATWLTNTLKEVKENVLIDLDLSGSTLEADVTVNYQVDCIRSLKLPQGMQRIKGHSFGGAKNLTEVYISDSVTELDSYAFTDCEKLEKIVISSTVTTIDRSAFSHCSNLKEIELPEGLTELKEGLFFSCSSLEKVKMPSSLKTIEKTVFFRCDGLTEIEIPASVTTIEANAFQSCSNLKKVIFQNPEGWQRSTNEGAPVDLSKDDLSDPEKAAKLLSNYDDYLYKWTRTNK